MAKLYRNYLVLLDKWPIDQSKTSRDLGRYIRDRLKESFKAGQLVAEKNESKCQVAYESLNRVADNYYSRLYTRRSNSSATGLTAEQCKTIISDDFMEYLKTNDTSLLSKVR